MQPLICNKVLWAGASCLGAGSERRLQATSGSSAASSRGWVIIGSWPEANWRTRTARLGASRLAARMRRSTQGLA